MDDLADAIVDKIGSGALRPRIHGVVRALAQELPALSALSADVLASFDAGGSVGDLALLTRLWEEIGSLPLETQGGRRMLVWLLHPDKEVNFEEASYIVQWSLEEGVAAEPIWAAFENA